MLVLGAVVGARTATLMFNRGLIPCRPFSLHGLVGPRSGVPYNTLLLVL